MKPPPIRYVRPANLEEAIGQLEASGAVALAGGQSLIGLLNLRRVRPACLVDLSSIAELRAVAWPTGHVVLGAMVTLADAERDADVMGALPVLAGALPLVANPQVRARSTFGGSLAHGDPVGEVLATLIALGASALVRGPAGERRVPVAELALARAELVVEVRIPVAAGARGAFCEIAPRFAARALASGAAVVVLDRDGLIADVRVAVAGVAASPTLLAGLDRLRGEHPASAVVAASVAQAVERVEAAEDTRADERYRREAATALAVRAVRDAAFHREATLPERRVPRRRETSIGRPASAAHAGATRVSLTVNGRSVAATVEPRLLLSDMLRDELGLHATHVGCEHGVCGACNVLVDGSAVRSCLMFAVQADSRHVRTLESLREEESIAALSDAFVEGHALQCGYCTPGFLVTLAELRAAEVTLTAADLVGNLCRCTGYAPILDAARGRPVEHSDPRSIARLGARRLVRGEGRYVGDVEAAGALHAVFVRSPLAHARIRGVRLEAARRSPGVVAAYCAADVLAQGGRDLPVGWIVAGQRPSSTPLLASDSVRYVGEAVAVVIADTAYLAEDGCELVELDLEPLDVVLDVEAATAPGAPLLHPDWGDNVLARQVVEGGDPDSAFARAEVIVGGRYEIARQTCVPIEPRGALARVDAATGEIVIVSSAQSPHHSAEHLSEALGVDQQSVRVIAPDVGGSFGAKDHACVEEAVIALAARALGLPVRWTQDRRENLMSGVHSRGQRYDVELAADRTGRILAVRGRLLYDAGARSGNHGAGTAVYSSLVLPGPYAFADYRLEMLALVTNKPSSAAFRGYGAPEAAFVMDGLIDELAHELGLDGAEVRRRNLIPRSAYPYRSATGLDYDAGDPRYALERALALAGGAPPASEGCLRGVGTSAFVLMGGFGPTRAALASGMTFGGYESARVRMNRDGHVTVAIGMPTQGQGIETALAQTAAAVLGVDPSTAVRLDSSDSARVPYSPVGAIASRGAAVGAAAVDAASRRLAVQLCRMAATMLAAPADELSLYDGHAVAPDRRRVPLRDVAAAIQRGELALADGETALEASATVDPAGETVSYGVNVAVVDVDPQTGGVRVVRYAAVNDCGRLINPAIVRGQIEGAIAQGIGGALMEELTFAADGTPLATTLFDYVLPTAADMPVLAIEFLETPSPITPNGARGAGELGIIGPGAAIAGAVSNALGAGVRARRLPLTPPYVRALARASSTGREPAPPR